MSLRTLLYTATGTLRAPWRIAAFILIAVVTTAVVLTAQLALTDDPALRDPTLIARGVSRGMIVQAWLLLLAMMITHVICLHVIERRPWSFVGLDPNAARPPILGAGFTLGAAAIGLPCLLLIGAGWLRVTDAPGAWWEHAISISLFLLPAALYEELMMRGYAFAVLREVWGARWTLIVTSALFGIFHALNPGATPASLAVVALAGIFLGAVLLRTRSLYAAWMAHFAWNWIMAVVLHTAVSGQPFPQPDFRTVDAGPDWATGGAWGPEGGAAAIAGMLAGLGLLIVRRRRIAGGAKE